MAEALAAADTGEVLAHFPRAGVNAVKIDASGNLYVAGYQGTTGSPDTYDAFVAKLSPDGSKAFYSTTLAGSMSDFVSALEIDATGAAYLFGQTDSPDFPVTKGALQTSFPATGVPGFVAKIDPQGKLVYATFLGGAGGAGGGILVDAAGEVYVSRTSGTPFVAKLDAAGANLLAEMQGLGGRLAFDSQGNVYVAGTTLNFANPTPTAGAFQTKVIGSPCSGTGQLAFPCFYQYVAKLNSALSQIVYTTFLDGSYGAQPAAIAVDAQGDAIVAGTTNSPDYPTTSGAFQPLSTANAPPCPQVSLFGSFCPPAANGYITKLNATGTGLVYSTLFSGSQTDSITFAAITSAGVYFAGQAGSEDLPGLEGVPQACLPQTYVSFLGPDGATIGHARLAGGNVVGYDATSGTFLVWIGSDLVRFDPASPQGPIACVLDAADLRPVNAFAPGELLTIFGSRFAKGLGDAATGPFPTTLDGVGVTFNGLPAPLLYVSPQQINVQAPFEIAGSAQATMTLSPTQGLGPPDSRTLPVVAANPTAFLDTVTLPYMTDLRHCPASTAVYSPGPLPLALNSDGSRNTCLNPASRGSTVAIFIQGLGVTGQAVTGGINPSPGAPLDLPVTGTTFNGQVVSVVSSNSLGGSIAGVWQVGLAPNYIGALPVSLSVGIGGEAVPVRDLNLIIWMK